jgi:hypothetical protein
MQTAHAPLIITDREGDAKCPFCNHVLPAIVIEDTLGKTLMRMKKEDPEMANRLFEKIIDDIGRNDKVARKQKVKRAVGIFVALAILFVVGYILLSRFN